jgi:hypothetical protein
MAPKSEEIVPVFATEPSKIDTSLTKMPHIAYENAASRDPRRDLAYVADVAREGSDQLDLDAGGAGRNSAGAAIDDVAGEERSVFDENAVSARGNRARVTDAPGEGRDQLDLDAGGPGRNPAAAAVANIAGEERGVVDKNADASCRGNCASVDDAAREGRDQLDIDAAGASHNPAAAAVANIAGEERGVVDENAVGVVLDIIVPLLVIPPRKVVTVLRKMPVKAVEIVPLFVMPPRKVAAFT